MVLTQRVFIEDISVGMLEDLRRRARRVRLVATDLDGTLFDQTHTLRDGTRRALKALTDRGIVLAIATGRARFTIPEAVTSLEGLGYIITANGAKLYVSRTWELIFEKYLSLDALDYARPLFSDDEVLCEVFWDGAPHVEEERYIKARDYGIPKWFSEYFFRTRIPTKDFENAIGRHISKIENINFVFGNETVEERLRSFLAKRTDLYVFTSSFPFNFEIGGTGVSKGAAVGFIANRERISAEETLCFGDQNNDVAMIKSAGIGVATANAVSRAQAAADFVTLSNEQEGVAAALKLLGLVSEGD